MNTHEKIENAFGFYSIFSGKWTMAITIVLYEGTKRFNEIKNEVPGLTSAVLSDKLRMMEENGLVTRVQYPEIPVRVEYTLTDKGMSTKKIVDDLMQWMDTYGCMERHHP